jgi:hypothetical protein
MVFISGLAIKVSGNGLRLGEGRALKTVSPNIVQMLIEVQMFNYFRQPCFCQTDVVWRFTFTQVLQLQADFLIFQVTHHIRQIQYP